MPYRNSSLTKLLKDSLGGNCNTVFMGTIAPTNYEEIVKTLKLA